jgi:hypothetical protein
MPITKINSLGITNPVAFSAGTAALPSITTSGDTNTGIFFPAADTMAFTEGGTEAMRIDSIGRVGIGITNPAKELDVRGASATLRLSESTSAGDKRMEIGVTSAGQAFIAANQSAQSIIFETVATERMSITSTGSLILVGSTAQKASGTSWSNPSDTRLKDNKQNYTKGLNELLQINVKTWEWNGKAGTTEGTTGIGVIADEIEVLLPNTVDTYKAKLNIDDTEETDVKRFDATEITWLLLNSVKEQQEIIEQLKARLTALESK